jgi:hypothetical protein
VLLSSCTLYAYIHLPVGTLYLILDCACTGTRYCSSRTRYSTRVAGARYSEYMVLVLTSTSDDSMHTQLDETTTQLNELVNVSNLAV